MKKKRRSIVDVARSRGSTATTPEGAKRYLLKALAGVKALPIPDEATARDRAVAAGTGIDAYAAQSRLARFRCVTHREGSRADARDRRLVARYRAAARLPAYLSARDRCVINWDSTRQAILAVRARPLFTRALYAEHFGVKDAVSAREWQKWDRARGELRQSATVASDACVRAPWGRLRKCYAGKSCMTPGVRTETNGKGGWNRVSWHYADYTYVCPRKRRGAWTSHYVDPCGVEHRVYRTRHFTRIDDGPAERVAIKAPDPGPLPVHVRRRLLALAGVPRALRIEYDRAERSRGLMVVDAFGERYHLDGFGTVEGARKAIRDAVAGLRKRRAERFDDERIRARAAITYVSVDDSVAAGNCPVGTKSFAEHVYAVVGAEGPCAVRADVILSIRNDVYTRRAVAAAMTR